MCVCICHVGTGDSQSFHDKGIMVETDARRNRRGRNVAKRELRTMCPYSKGDSFAETVLDEEGD